MLTMLINEQHMINKELFGGSFFTEFNHALENTIIVDFDYSETGIDKAWKFEKSIPQILK